MYIQLVNPDTTVTMPAGWCLGLVQRVYGAPGLHNTAWEAWEATTDKHLNRELPEVSVPVWFDHYGTYDGVTGQFGHVVAWIPERNQFLSSPANGTGQDWVNTIQEVERRYNSKYVGWSTDINTVKVAEYTSQPEGADPMAKLYRNKTTSEVAAINIDSGYIYTVPTYDHLILIQGWHIFENDEPISLDDNVFNYVKDLARLAPAYKAAENA
jgi:hypothetical protein